MASRPRAHLLTLEQVSMQYFKPAGEFFVGDCMPFYHDGVFHLYWLLDEKHHQALGGLGGHQWAHMSTTDLVTWQHHPLALGITEPWEGSICTGSTFYHAGLYYAFYAVRLRDRTQQLMVATSRDSIHFEKSPTPLMKPPAGYSPYHFRDPFVFQDPTTGRFHMLVTAMREPFPLPGRGGCLAHLLSDDLRTWEIVDPFVLPGLTDAPECPDLFEWNGWYYLVFSNHLQARYLCARSPLGPWERPPHDLLDGPWSRVPKTAAFPPNRRIVAGWLGTREHDQDQGKFQWGGQLVLRELVQHADGTLGSKFLPEAARPVAPPRPLALAPLHGDVTVRGGEVKLTAKPGMAAAMAQGLPQAVRIRLRLRVEPGTHEVGLQLRAANISTQGVGMVLSPHRQRLTLGDAVLSPLPELAASLTLEIILYDDIVDLCLDDRACLINRVPAAKGDQLVITCRDGSVTVEEIEVCPLVRG